MHFTLHWPQLVYLALTITGVIYSTLQHGKPRTNENVWTVLIATAISLVLLYCGGFFR